MDRADRPGGVITGLDGTRTHLVGGDAARRQVVRADLPAGDVTGLNGAGAEGRVDDLPAGDRPRDNTPVAQDATGHLSTN